MAIPGTPNSSGLGNGERTLPYMLESGDWNLQVRESDHTSSTSELILLYRNIHKNHCTSGVAASCTFDSSDDTFSERPSLAVNAGIRR